MIVSQSFNKHVAVTDAVVFELINANEYGFAVFIENQDLVNVMVYRFETTVDGGTTWDLIAFPTEEGGSADLFSLLARDTHLLKVPVAGRVRLVAHGDLDVGIHVAIFRKSAVDNTPLTIINQ